MDGGLGIVTLPVQSTPVRETYHPTRGVTHPAATPPYCVNYICLGKPTLLPRVQGIDGVWELGKTLFERPSGPLLEWGFSAMAETLLLLCCLSGSERWKAFCAPPGNSFSFANSAIAMRPCFILLNAVTMVTTIVFNHHPGLQNVRSLVALSPVSQSHHAIPGKLTLC